MGPQDGVDYALRALAHLHGPLGRDDLHTTFIGSGDAFDELVALAGRLGLDDVVEFTGRVPDETVQRYLSTADVCLSPDPKNPLNDVSSMNKVVEYMAMSRPLVSFDLREARVTASDAAVYAPDNDEIRFAELTAELLDDPERRERMGAIGRRRVEANLSWETSRTNLLAAYEDLLDSPMRRQTDRRAIPRVPEAIPPQPIAAGAGQLQRCLMSPYPAWRRRRGTVAGSAGGHRARALVALPARRPAEPGVDAAATATEAYVAASTAPRTLRHCRSRSRRVDGVVSLTSSGWSAAARFSTTPR
jgi:hypothetical protein